MLLIVSEMHGRTQENAVISPLLASGPATKRETLKLVTLSRLERTLESDFPKRWRKLIQVKQTRYQPDSEIIADFMTDRLEVNDP